MPRKPAKAARLPSGKYSWRGRAVSFSKLPKAERSRFRSLWARKAAKVRALHREPYDRKKAREWLKRRNARLTPDGTYKIGKRTYKVAPILEITDKFSPNAILEARQLAKEAHRAWMKQDRHGGGRALKIANQIRASLGAELAAYMPQLWWYH